MANRVLLVGRVATEPELKYTPSGIAVANFRIAVDRPFQNNQTGDREADFFTVKVWRDQAERVANHLMKGQLVVVDGRLEQRSWDAPDGTKRYATEAIAYTVAFQDPNQMMFAVMAAANHMVSESMRLLNRVSSGDGGREDAGGDRGSWSGSRPAAAPMERPAAPAGSPGGPSPASNAEPDFGDPFNDQ